MLVEDTGELKLIELLSRVIADDNTDCIQRLNERGFRLRLPIGDDAAAWDSPLGVRVLTTDTMVEGVHFELDHVSWRDLGWKSLAVNLSDIAAMGCIPVYSVVTLGLRGDLPTDGLLQMYRGMMDLCRLYGGAIVGGDIVRSPVFFVTVALEGSTVVSEDGGAVADLILTRGSAKPGDQIAVTGHLGCSAGGLNMLMEKGRDLRSWDEETANHLRASHQRPLPRVPEGVVLAQHGVETAIDISDGLVDDLGKMCKASGVGAMVHSQLVPVDDVLRKAYPQDWLDLALGGGEDYELLFAASSPVVKQIAAVLDVPVSVIGEIVDGPSEVRIFDSLGRLKPVQRRGWDHFRKF